jgi:hypothetical protein
VVFHSVAVLILYFIINFLNCVLDAFILSEKDEVIITIRAKLEIFFVKCLSVKLAHPRHDVRSWEHLNSADWPDLSVKIVEQVSNILLYERVVVDFTQSALLCLQHKNVFVTLIYYQWHL